MNILVYPYLPIDSRMYMILENNEALIIDPCKSEEALKVLQSYAVSNILVLLTHEHYDHISGVNWLRSRFDNITVLCSQRCSEAIMSSYENLAAFSSVLSIEEKKNGKHFTADTWDEDYSCYADKKFSADYEIIWNGHAVYMKETPGHSKGSICILLDNQYLFSGDTLVTGYSTVTKLPGGSRKQLLEITVPYLQSLNPETMVYPGHGERQLLKEYELLKECGE